MKRPPSRKPTLSALALGLLLPTVAEAEATTLQPSGPVWVRATPAPPEVFIAGQEPARPLALCRGRYGDRLHLGKVVDGRCNIAEGGVEITLDDFEIATRVRHPVWVRGAQGRVPDGAASMGRAAGRELLACRAEHLGGLHPGELAGGRCVFGYGGREIRSPRYEVLVLPRRARDGRGAPVLQPDPAPKGRARSEKFGAHCRDDPCPLGEHPARSGGSGPGGLADGRPAPREVLMLSPVHQAVLDVIDDWCGTGRKPKWPPPKRAAALTRERGSDPHPEPWRFALGPDLLRTLEPSPEPWQAFDVDAIGAGLSLLQGLSALSQYAAALPEGAARTQLLASVGRAMDETCGTGRLAEILRWLRHHLPPPPPPPWVDQVRTATVLQEMAAASEGELTRQMAAASVKLVQQAAQAMTKDVQQLGVGQAT